MIDIVNFTDGLGTADAETSKAGNVLATQLGSLEYAPTFGIDLEFFLDPDYQFQNESFRAYLIQRLAENHINVSAFIESLEQFYLQYTFAVGPTEPSGGGFIK